MCTCECVLCFTVELCFEHAIKRLSDLHIDRTVGEMAINLESMQL